MFRNYLKIALRNLRKQRFYSCINIAGLALGLACCILMLLYVQDELSYDQYHEKADQVYRVAMTVKSENKLTKSASTPAPVGSAILAEYPEVANVARLFPLSEQTLVSYGEKRFYEEHVIVAEASLLDVFSFPLLIGNPETAFSNPNSILITEEMAVKYFGAESPLGKTLTFREQTEYQVTAVLKNIPSNSHFSFDMVLPLSPTTIARFQYDNFLEEWWDWSCYNYLLLRPDQSPTILQSKLPTLIEKYIGEEFHSTGTEVELFLQPLTEIYLKSHLGRELGANSDIAYIYIFTTIAFLVLCISIINYVNLSTAGSLVRAKEVGVRKALGATKGRLIKQFLGESVVLALIATTCAVLLIEILLSHFNDLAQKDLVLDRKCLAGIPVLVVSLGLLAGGYPSIVLSSFASPTTLRGQLIRRSPKGGSLRQVLVVLQFTISIILIIAMLTVDNQKEYLRNKVLGFNKEQIVVLKLNDLQLRWQTESLKNALLQLAEVSDVTFSQSVPGLSRIKQGYGVEGSTDMTLMNTLLIDADFLRTYDLALVAGRDFSKERPTDRTSGFIINEAAARELGWKNPLGRQLKWGVTQKTGQVIGVIRDFHFRSLHQRIEPLVLHIEPVWYRNISVKVTTQEPSQTLKRLTEVWSKFSPNYPFDYFFLDESIARLYAKEAQFNNIIGSASMLANFIACLGLHGLAAFTSERRTKEIGLRKVLGATVMNVTALLSKDFVKLVLLANFVAFPVAWFAINRWLQNFAYRVDIGWQVFAFAGALALIIALMTISFQVFKATVANPVESLRYE